MNGFYAIAIDGPSGAGKSSLARKLAGMFQFIYVDTGAIYRTVGLAAYRAGIDRRDEAAVAALLPKIQITMGYNEAGEQRLKLLHLLKAFPVSISGTRPIDEAIVTAGGVSTKEVNPRTMESKLVKGLYFAGELLDLDGYTGGFNLQIAWSTGFVAGNSVLKDEYL